MEREGGRYGAAQGGNRGGTVAQKSQPKVRRVSNF